MEVSAAAANIIEDYRERDPASFAELSVASLTLEDGHDGNKDLGIDKDATKPSSANRPSSATNTPRQAAGWGRHLNQPLQNQLPSQYVEVTKKYAMAIKPLRRTSPVRVSSPREVVRPDKAPKAKPAPVMVEKTADDDNVDGDVLVLGNIARSEGEPSMVLGTDSYHEGDGTPLAAPSIEISIVHRSTAGSPVLDGYAVRPRIFKRISRTTTAGESSSGDHPWGSAVAISNERLVGVLGEQAVAAVPAVRDGRVSTNRLALHHGRHID
jgi:hypothetical protein